MSRNSKVDPIQTLRLALQFASFDNPEILTGSLTILQELDKELFNADLNEELSDELVTAVKDLNEVIISEIPNSSKKEKEADDIEDTDGKRQLTRGSGDDAD